MPTLTRSNMSSRRHGTEALPQAVNIAAAQGPSMPTRRETVAVSAPGKVLLAGGYLVLDRRYTGLVLGLSARINVVAAEIRTSEGVQLNEIVVDSPQFLEAQWRYGYRLAPEGGGIKVTQLQV